MLKDAEGPTAETHRTVNIALMFYAVTIACQCYSLCEKIDLDKNCVAVGARLNKPGG